MADSASRRPPRHRVSLFVAAGDDEPVPFGRTRDLSVTGVFVETGERPGVEDVVKLGLVWGEDSLICAARVVRHTDDGIGLSFMKPDPFFLRAIVEILNTTPPVEVVCGLREDASA